MGKWRTASLFACLLLVAGGAGAQNTAPLPVIRSSLVHYQSTRSQLISR